MAVTARDVINGDNRHEFAPSAVDARSLRGRRDTVCAYSPVIMGFPQPTEWRPTNYGNGSVFAIARRCGTGRKSLRAPLSVTY